MWQFVEFWLLPNFEFGVFDDILSVTVVEGEEHVRLLRCFLEAVSPVKGKRMAAKDPAKRETRNSSKF